MNLERIGLQDLQDLAESLSNLNVVDLKVNEVPETETREPQIPPQGNPGVHPSREFTHERFKTDAYDASGSSRKSNRCRQKIHDTPVGRAALEPIYPYGLTLNLDDAEFKDREALIDDWGVAMKITAATLELDRESFIKMIKLSVVGTVKDAFENTLEVELNKIWGNEGDNDLGRIVDRAVEAWKVHFVEVGYNGNAHNEKGQMYQLALYNLRLVILTQESLSKFLRLFMLYWLKSPIKEELANELFFLKFPTPWREEIMKGYTPGAHDNVGRRMSYAQKKLSDWCIEATTHRNIKKLRKHNKSASLICTNVALKTKIGAEEPFQQRRKKNRFQPYASKGGRRRSS